jgi:hypothetical protein
MGEATVVGTRFGLAHNRKGSLLQVIEGTVRYRRLADNATLDVVAGYSLLASPDRPFELRPNRVDRGVKMMYLFDEMAGTTVHDVSGVGDPLDLTIGDPVKAVWTANGLNDGGGGSGIGCRGNGRKFFEAVKASHGLTIEFWCSVSGTSTAEVVTTIKMWNGSFVSTSWAEPKSRVPGLDHVALVFTERDGNLVLTSYDKTPDVTSKILGEVAASRQTMLREDALNIDVSPDAPAPGATMSTELHMLAFYGRALSEAEVRQNEKAGVPTSPPLGPVDE